MSEDDLSKECKARLDRLESAIATKKLEFKGEERVFKDGDLTVKVFVKDGVILQVFVYPFDLKKDYQPVFEKLLNSGIFDDCIKADHYILKVGLAMWQKVYGEYLTVMQEDKSGIFVRVVIDVQGFMKEWKQKHGM